MNTQTSLLVIVSSLFATIWSNDHPVATDGSAPHRYEASSVDHGMAGSTQTPATVISPRLTLPILPANIGEGHWRAVNHDGETREFTITSDQVSKSATSSEFFSHGEGDSRWYFIRMNAGPDRIAESSDSITR